MVLDAVQMAFLSLVRRFVERQKLVYAVMEQMRPDKLMFVRMYEQQAAPPSEEEERAYLNYALQYAGNPQGGFWGRNNEWMYYFHGGGCRLIHTITGEPIDWDAPDVNRLDRFFFVDYLKWAFRSNSADPAVVTARAAFAEYQSLNPGGKLKDFTHGILDQLSSAGYLMQDDEHLTYTL
jgi:hypothetical protein